MDKQTIETWHREGNLPGPGGVEEYGVPAHLLGAAPPAPDAHLEADYDDRLSVDIGLGNPYEGTDAFDPDFWDDAPEGV